MGGENEQATNATSYPLMERFSNVGAGVLARAAQPVKCGLTKEPAESGSEAALVTSG